MTANLLSLPLEALEVLFDFLPSQAAFDLVATCRAFEPIVELRHFWTKKLLREFPSLNAIDKSEFNGFDTYKNIVTIHNSCWEKIKEMPSLYHQKQICLPDSHIEEFFKKPYECGQIGLACVDFFLKTICNADCLYSDDTFKEGSPNMTYKVYAFILLDHFSHEELKKKWQTMILDERHITPEKVIAFHAQWLEPKHENFEINISEYFDSVALSVHKRFPKDHPLHGIDESVKKSWSHTLLNDNYFEATVSLDVIDCVRLELRNQTSLINTTSPNIESMLFQNILNKTKGLHGNTVLSPIFLELVLRRCGIKCEIVYFNNHYLLTWRESWSSNSPLYIVDPYSNNLRLSERRCPYSNATRRLNYSYDPVSLLLTLVLLVRQMSCPPRRLFKNAVELAHFLQPYEIEHIHLLTLLYTELKKEVFTIRDKLLGLLDPIPEDTRERWTVATETLFKLEMMCSNTYRNSLVEINVRTRSKNLQYAVGMVCIHKLYQYECVITGWDNFCAASGEWKVHMGVHSLQRGESQPFYHVIAGDYSNRYVAEENLIIMLPPHEMKEIEEALSKDFSHFNGYYYVPNAEKDAEYPEDKIVRLHYKETRLSLISHIF